MMASTAANYAVSEGAWADIPETDVIACAYCGTAQIPEKPGRWCCLACGAPLPTE